MIFKSSLEVTQGQSVGYYSNEMATLHLIKSYCVPSVLYGCETWYLDRHDYHDL